MPETGAFLYSKAAKALQARSAAGTVRMHISQETLFHSRMQSRWRWGRIGMVAAPALAAGIWVTLGSSQVRQEEPSTLELTRAVRPWEFLPIAGTRAGLLGKESGRMEAWVYPL